MKTQEPITLPAPELTSAFGARSKWEREFQAFLRLLPELLRTHRGQYVAIHDERVVDSGPDPITLIKRGHAQYGYVPIHVEQVLEQAASGRTPHYREVRQGKKG